MSAVIHGWTVRTLLDPEKFPEIKAHIEDAARLSFEVRHGFTPGEPVWRFEAAHDWTDPETGETLHLPDEWICVVEGIS